LGKAVRIDRRLEEGEVIDLGDGTTLEVLHTPGHSAGSISLYCPRAGALITGDLLQPVGHLPLYGDLGRTRRSIERLIALPDVRRLYASHAERPCEGAEVAEALNQSLAYLDRMDGLVREAQAELPEPRTPEAITRHVLTRLGFDPPPVMPSPSTASAPISADFVRSPSSALRVALRPCGVDTPAARAPARLKQASDRHTRAGPAQAAGHRRRVEG
jgi:hypothetical protein